TKPARWRGTHRQATQRPVRDDEAVPAPRVNDHRLKTVRASRRLIPRSQPGALPLKNAVRRICATRSTITPARGPHMPASSRVIHLEQQSMINAHAAQILFANNARPVRQPRALRTPRRRLIRPRRTGHIVDVVRQSRGAVDAARATTEVA